MARSGARLRGLAESEAGWSHRVDPSYVGGTGTPTNELMRHIFLLTILQAWFGGDITPYLIAAFLLNSVSMLVPFAMPHLVRSMTKSATAIVCVNVALVIVWCIPVTAPFIAAVFLGTYVYSFAAGGVRRLRRA